jgi:hypothetical protein
MGCSWFPGTTHFINRKGNADMMRKMVIALMVGVFIMVVAVAAFLRGPSLSRYDVLKSPQIRSMPAQKMLVVEAVGSPDKIGVKAFGLLMKTWFALKRKQKVSGIAAPRARWPLSDTVSKDQWLGRYAMPVSETFNSIPASGDPGLKISIQTWTYGNVAEILHVGPYSAEKPTIQKLKDFILSSGYQIIGEHEEEYLRGPTMFGPGNPSKYYTIIRYQINKP